MIIGTFSIGDMDVTLSCRPKIKTGSETPSERVFRDCEYVLLCQDQLDPGKDRQQIFEGENDAIHAFVSLLIGDSAEFDNVHRVFNEMLNSPMHIHMAG